MNITLSDNKSSSMTIILVKTTFLFILLFSHNSYSKSSNINFIETVITTPFKLTHPVMPIDILNNKGKELVTFSVDDLGDRWLMIYVLNEQETYTEYYRTPLPKDFYSFDISTWQADKLQTLYFLSSNNIYLLNQAQIEKKLPFKSIHAISSIAKGNNEQYLAKAHFISQLSNDKYDDIYIADFNQVHVFIQTEQGLKTSVLPIQPEALFTSEEITYFKTNIHFGDVNFDHLQDVMYIHNGQLVYFLQQADSTISPIPHTIAINKLISNIDWWNKLGADGEKLDQSNLSYRKIEQIKDINNDNIIDMVVRFTQSEGVLNKTNDYEIYLGQNIDSKLYFLDLPDSAIKAEGTLTDIQFVDINNDKKDEILVAGFDIGLSQIIGALLSGSIDQDVHLFYMDDKGHFNKKSKVTKEVQLNFSLSSGTSGNPVVILLDVNGDKLQDLMLSEDDDTLKIYLGTDNARLFAKKPKKYETVIPDQGEMLVTDDLNNDGKDDILIKYGRADEKKYHNTFRILMSVTH
ncbi:FG-GAP repeat domain-containing protein [Pseudocolwellia agarivorans]|uniref:FG-GAP repeat domain-containing protein n=1 Tax=Pseudocolwellia agarivorans TaxID=1911682 RepID=UPI0011155042|nr:VCBS repeat-containing protein [Pseudocolwellia agarivorans]